ncbi:MAG TPA: zinc-binding dehydrogenase [Opitutaceae bacterium]|jgi:NADPH:quinone reductase-like Zn-dependent oxidoreductase
MRALRIESVGRLALAEVPDPVPGEGEVVVELRAAALNHRDVWIKLGQYAGLKFPCIPGSDGAGLVHSVGSGVDPKWEGREVVINPGMDWGSSEAAQASKFTILGLPREGTLAERVSVPATQLAPKPGHLTWEEAAALPLAGLTGWRALFSRSRLGPGERVLVTGIGGGVALFVLQFAVASGNEVWVTSSSDQKIARAVSLGAKGGFRYDREGWAGAAAKAPGLFDVIVDSAGGPGFGSLIDLSAPGGRVTFYGATRGNVPELALRKIFWRQISLLGTTMGSPADWEAMTAFFDRHRLRPVVSEIFPLGSAPEAFAQMEAGGQFGKIVLRIPGS